MKIRLFLCFIICILTMNVYGQSNNELYKINIVKSNNVIIKDNYLHLVYPEKIGSSDYKDLKEYVLQNIKADSSRDPEFIMEMLNWVSRQWKHDGRHSGKDMTSLEILNRAKNGEQFRCVEYGKVLKDVLLSFGYVSRSVGLKSPSVAYGGFGQGHVATEVWSNSLGKWIFIDPQFSVYVKYNGRFLNYYEMYDLKKSGKFNEIEFLTDRMFNDKKDKDAYIDNYKNFIIGYFGYVDIPYKTEDRLANMVLLMEGENGFMTFQGESYNNNIFTSDTRDLYFDINRTMFFFTYRNNESKDIFKEFNIKTNEDYLAKMPLFAAKPDFTINLRNNTPWFSHYELTFNGKTVVVKEQEYDISLSEGINEIQVVAVNQAGLHGIPSNITIKYGKD